MNRPDTSPSDQNVNVHHYSKVLVCRSIDELQSTGTCSKKNLDPQYRCDLCGKKYCSLSVLKTHRIRHRSKEELPFSCLFCPYRCATKGDYMRHRNQHIRHAQPTYNCGLCEKIFKSSTSLSDHMKSIHTKDTKFQCGICNFTTLRRSTMRAHLMKHGKPEVGIICPVCMATFLTKANLKIHLMTHADARPFTCNKCDKKFTAHNRLIAHQHSVHSSQAFQCERCQKNFSSVHNLKRHSLIHTGERPFSCFCQFSSNTQGNLVKHVRKVHKLIHFTYKDILRKRGEMADPTHELSSSELLNLVEEGKKVSESHLKKLRKKGLTSTSLEQLQQEQKLQIQAKESLKLQTEEKLRAKAARKKISETNIKKKIIKPKKKITIEVGNVISKVDSFYLSNCDFILPKDHDGTYVFHNNDGEVLSTTPAIQVIWNVSGLENPQKDSNLINAKRKKIFGNNPGQRKRKSMVNPIKKTIICEDFKLSNSSRFANSPSTVLEDHYVTVNEKSSAHNLFNDANDYQTSANVLVTSLESTDRVDSIVAFDGIEPSNTIAVTSDCVNDIDRTYKNMILYSNHFMHSNDNSHFISAYEPGGVEKERKRRGSKFKLCNKRRSNSKEDCSLTDNLQRLTEQHSPSISEIKHTTKFRQIFKDIPVPHTFVHESNKNPVNDQSSSLAASCSHEGSKDIKVEASEHSFLEQNSSPQHCRASSIKNISSQSAEQSDLVIVLRNIDEKITQEINRTGIVNEDILNLQMKQITIKNSLSTYNLINDHVDVMSIAEMEENEKEVVLVVDGTGMV